MQCNPAEVYWIVAHNYIRPHELVILFIKEFPRSIITTHCLMSVRCTLCTQKIIELMKGGGYLTGL
jgi:hypothetical protein